jgi:hypothetical protein
MRGIFHTSKITIGIIFLLAAVLTGCKGNAINDAQTFKYNKSPVIDGVSASYADGRSISADRIEPYALFVINVRAADPDNNPLSYTFSSPAGSFMNTAITPSGCTVVFKTGNISGGQSVNLWVNVSDANGAIARRSFDLGAGKIGPTIAASFDKIRITSDGYINLSVSANCAGFFQIVPDGDETSDVRFQR